MYESVTFCHSRVVVTPLFVHQSALASMSFVFELTFLYLLVLPWRMTLLFYVVVNLLVGRVGRTHTHNYYFHWSWVNLLCANESLDFVTLVMIPVDTTIRLVRYHTVCWLLVIICIVKTHTRCGCM